MRHLVLFAILTAAHSSSVEKRIIGGLNAKEKNYPWAASMKGVNPKTQSVTYCGSTIIADQWLLTAAHCFWAGSKKKTHLFQPKSWHIQAGSVKIELGASSLSKEKAATVTDMQSYLLGSFFTRILDFLKSGKKKKKENIVHASIDKIILHPKYQPDDLEYDIALVKLSTKLPLNSERIGLAKLPTSDKPQNWPPVDSKCTFVGWGCRKSNTGPSATAQVVSLKVLPNNDCSELYEHGAGLNAEHEFCAGYYKSDVGICAGDSGSGLIYLYKRQPVVVGIASATHGQRPGDYPGLFTRVASFTEWIVDMIDKAS